MADAVSWLEELVDEFEATTGRRPWATELAELLTLELQSLRDGLIHDLAPGAEVRIATVPTAQHPPGGSLVGEVGDGAFVAAGELMAAAAGVEGAASATVAAALEALLRTSADSVLGDDPPVVVVTIAIVGKPRAAKPRAGDIVAIPAGSGKSFLAVVIAKNRFGTAYGLFDGTHEDTKVPTPTASDHPKPLPHPVYSDDDPVISGRWRVIGHDDGLLDQFPSDPEIYHYDDEESGKPARAETADGELREVSADEAREVGLTDESYRQIWLAQQLERRLADAAS